MKPDRTYNQSVQEIVKRSAKIKQREYFGGYNQPKGLPLDDIAYVLAIVYNKGIAKVKSKLEFLEQQLYDDGREEVWEQTRLLEEKK